MGARGQDVIGFTRIFLLFCSLVLLPALLLSGFGVIAIVNERQAEKQRRFEAANELFDDAQRAFAEELDALDRRALRAAQGAEPERDLAALRDAGVSRWILVDADGRPFAGDAALTTDADVVSQVQRIAARVVRGHAAHATVDVDALAGVLSLQRLTDGGLLTYVVDVSAIGDALQTRFRGPFHLRLRSLERTEPVQGAVERLAEMVRARAEASTADAAEELLAKNLAPPFERTTLTIDDRGARSHLTMIAYIVLLVVFLATLITGVVITARLIWQETRLSRLKTDFVSHMSHELRTPLTSIRMFIETLKMGRASPEEAQECLFLLAKETERLSEMIERVLGYARLRAGRRLFNVAPVPVKDAVDEVIVAFRAQRLVVEGEDEVVDLGTELAKDLPPLLVDRDAFVEALLNLVSNAYKYSGPRKEITVFARPGKRGRVLVGVRDNGPGLPKAEQKRVFERFYQGGGLLSSRTKEGSGLGLAITRAIVEGNGGRISVESETGRGATFVMDMRHA